MRRMTAERRTSNSARRFSTDLFAAGFSGPVAVRVRPSALANRFIGKPGSRSETSSAKNSLVAISKRRSTTEPDRVAPALSHCSSLKPVSASSSRFFPASKEADKIHKCFAERRLRFFSPDLSPSVVPKLFQSHRRFRGFHPTLHSVLSGTCTEHQKVRETRLGRHALPLAR